MPTLLRTTRVVCISDTHSTFPDLPRGDVLVHAGDLTEHGTFSELQQTIRWIEETDFEVKIIVAGHQDMILDEPYVGRNRPRIDRLMNSAKFTYLKHGAATIRLTRPTGPKTSFKVFGSPLSPGFGPFGYQKKEAIML